VRVRMELATVICVCLAKSLCLRLALRRLLAELFIGVDALIQQLHDLRGMLSASLQIETVTTFRLPFGLRRTCSVICPLGVTLAESVGVLVSVTV
jgi:hypothetical protein